MNNRIAQNALNYFLSKKFTFDGTDFSPLLEIVRDLQTDIASGTTANQESGAPETESS